MAASVSQNEVRFFKDYAQSRFMKLNAATSIASEYTLHDQPSAKNLLYRVVAINKAGEGIPRNTVNVSL